VHPGVVGGGVAPILSLVRATVTGPVGDHHVGLEVGVDDGRRPVDRDGQAHHQGAPTTGGVLEVQLAAHGLDETARDGQAETDPGAVVGVTEALEGEEDQVAVGRSDAGTVVDDPQVDPVGHPPGLHPDGPDRSR